MNAENKEIRVAGLVKESIVDGPGFRYVVFAQGCRHNCIGCHNPETHDTEGGTLVALESIIAEIAKNPLLDGITFSGGEPFLQAAVLAELAKLLRRPGFNVLIYTGYTYEYLREHQDENEGWRELLENADYLIDGPFILEQRSLNLRFRGSKNQRMIDLATGQQID